VPTPAPAIDEASNIDLVAYHDLEGRPAFKLALHRSGDAWYLYLGHHWHSGCTILDVTDAAHPRFVRFIEGPPGARTSQVQAAGDLLVMGVERPVYGEERDWDPQCGGALLWDLAADPTNPRLVGHYRSGGDGTHRNFYAGGSHLFAAVRRHGIEQGGYLAIVDVSSPGEPLEISRFGDEPGSPFFHGPAYVVGDRAYCSFGDMVVVDVADLTTPRLVSTVDFGAFSGMIGCHSAVPFPARELVVANGEPHAEGFDTSLNFVAVVDVSDERRPRILSTLPVPRPTPAASYVSYQAKGGRFGPHNQHHHQGHPDLWEPQQTVVVTYFSAGLRIFTIEDPCYPEEVGAFVPGPPSTRHGPRPRGALVSHFEDVLVDKRGYIFCTDSNHGLFVLGSAVPLI
jgi:hypothetical protein